MGEVGGAPHEADGAGLIANAEGLEGGAGATEIPVGEAQETPLALIIVQSIAVFLLAGLAEIGGGWLVWGSLREGKPAWNGVVGAFVLALYGVVATWQPQSLDFGRVYAAYGGYFIVLSLLWGVFVDRALVLDTGDLIGCALSLAGAAFICLWPRASAAYDGG
mmetsp:Transcript_3124/g.7817  ORF Transcript_3124/g.7817 Transcript_3124/m.7817 type:complete len:163 (-) Transcript_3124:2207-2695(-)